MPDPLTGAAGVGAFEPADTRLPEFTRLDRQMLERLRRCTGLAATVSDILEEAGWSTSLSADIVRPRNRDPGTVVGHVQTLSYLPVRRQRGHTDGLDLPPRLAHHTVFRLAEPGDVVVVDVDVDEPIATMGGLAFTAAASAGLSAVLVDGAVRDIDQGQDLGLPIWSRWVTPRSGKARLEAVAINAPVGFAGIQVLPGDLAVADATGFCFIPGDIASAVAERALEISDGEQLSLGSPAS